MPIGSHCRHLRGQKNRPSRVATKGRPSDAVGSVLLATLLAWAMSACAPQTPPDVANRAKPAAAVSAATATWNASPPLYSVRAGRGARLEILGTIHIGPESGWSFPPAVERARKEADAILLEVDLRGIGEEEISQAIMRYGILPPTTPLSTLISPETARLFALRESLLTRSGASPQTRAAMQPWLISLMLSEVAFREGGYSTEQSVEEGLIRILGQRELLSLERFDEQLGFFGSMPFEQQEAMLQFTLEHWDESDTQLTELIESWRTNDHDALYRLTREGVAEKPILKDVYAVLIDQRNRNWLPRLIELLEDPARAETTVLVAVGAGHLVGPRGVPSLLRERGYVVEGRALEAPAALAPNDR